jgi:hypothetical protein
LKGRLSAPGLRGPGGVQLWLFQGHQASG